MFSRSERMVDNPWDADLENGPRQDIARTGRVFRNATFQRRFLKAMVRSAKRRTAGVISS